MLNLESLKQTIKKPEQLNLKPETLKFAEELKLKDQYESQIKILSQAGITEILPEKFDHGIVGIDGKEYPTPSYEEILKKIDNNIEILKQKKDQGFTKMLLVPFASPLNLIAQRYQTLLLKHSREEKLLSTSNEKLELDTKDPLYKWEEYERADVDDKLVYYPKQFDKVNHGGKTKTEILNSDNPSGWEIQLIEDMPDLPKENQGKTINNRKQLEANDTPINYLNKLQTDPQYKYEQGLIPEACLTYAIAQLEEKNQVIDDYQDQGKICYNLGAYFKDFGNVPYGCFYRDYRQAYLYRCNVDYRYGSIGFRPSVRVDILNP